jgi:CRP/FNR family cyclic AMP-dependent transcriptional regulator
MGPTAAGGSMHGDRLMKTTIARRSPAEQHPATLSLGRAEMIARDRRSPDFDGFLRAAGLAKMASSYQRGDVVYSQGDLSDSVMYVERGIIKLSVTSYSGKEAIVAMLVAGDFLGESALTGHPIRQERATAMTTTTVLAIQKEQMVRLLHGSHVFSERFITHMLGRNTRSEEDLADQLFHSSEKRLARMLILLARTESASQADRVLPRISQQTLAEMIGTTRSRVNFFMNKFKRLGFIDYRGGLTINSSLSSVLSGDERPASHSGSVGRKKRISAERVRERTLPAAGYSLS